MNHKNQKFIDGKPNRDYNPYDTDPDMRVLFPKAQEDDGIVMKNSIDLGDNHSIAFACWSPDRGLNPQYDGLPDVEKYSAIVRHLKPDGSACVGAITLENEVSRKLEPQGTPMWKVESWEPLTLSPSLLCRECGDHGFIRNGKWERA